MTAGASHAELGRFFELSLELLCVGGLEDGHFMHLNPSWERVLGYTTAELKASPFIDFVHPDDRDASLAEVAGLAAGITLISFENRFRRRDGSYVWMQWTATPSIETGFFYAAGSDVTERKRAELASAERTRSLAGRAANLERQNIALERDSSARNAHQIHLERMVDVNIALLDASVDGIRLVDLDGRTLLANSVIEQLARDVFGHAAGATLQEFASLSSRLSDPASYLATLAAIAADPECSTKDDFEVVDARRAFQRHTGPVHDAAGALIGRIIVIRECTAEREAARLKSELVATVSHELRTPLTGVLGFAELLLQRDLDDDTRRRYAKTIQGEALRLTALVDDFLDLQKIEAGRFTLAVEPFELGELLRDQVDLFSTQSAGHTLVCDDVGEALELTADRDRIAQVLANLLSNAIKYSPAGGTVTVAATAREGWTRVGVTDRGVGIPASQQAQVFTRFFRVDSSDTRKIGGTGLGLALCHEIVTAHGGHIGFESTEGEGSTFWFELPSGVRTTTVDRRGRILVIEDDPALGTLLRECLAQDGLTVESAGTGERGLERALADPPAAILLDIGLPGGLDGWQVLARLKADARTASVPVIVCTARSGRDAAALLGASDFVAKPFSGDHLRATVGRFLPPERGSVLVVEDDETLRQLVVETLARDGRDLREAAGGEEALAMIAADQPDVLVLDLGMEGVDGFAVLEQLRESAATRRLPVVVLTGRVLSEREEKLLTARCTWLLQKHQYSAEMLRTLVHEALELERPDTPARAA